MLDVCLTYAGIYIYIPRSALLIVHNNDCTPPTEKNKGLSFVIVIIYEDNESSVTSERHFSYEVYAMYAS
jgi:hypothetical protein